MPATHRETLLVALGGNALIRKGEIGTAAEQFENLKLPVRQIARLSGRFKILITHGNGPQVGNLLLHQESCQEVPKLPLEILVAQTQGQIGYMIESRKRIWNRVNSRRGPWGQRSRQPSSLSATGENER